jgi:hypothetical protein
VDGTVGLRRDLLQRDLTEGLLVLSEIVAEDVPEGLGLLRAEIDAFEVFDDELFGALLGHGAEDEEEIPYAHADLHAVGVVFAVALGGGELEGRLIGRLVGLAHGFTFWKLLSCLWCGWKRIWCERGDLNPHGLLRQILSLVRLPISPLSHV